MSDPAAVTNSVLPLPLPLGPAGNLFLTSQFLGRIPFVTEVDLRAFSLDSRGKLVRSNRERFFMP